MGAVILIGLGVAVAVYFFRWKERADASARLLAEASYIQGGMDATPGPPDEDQVRKMVDLIVAARPDIVEALAKVSKQEAVGHALELAMAVFPGKPYTQMVLMAALAAAADQLREAIAPPPVAIAPPWPSGPSGLTGQYTSPNTAFSGSDMDASMIAAIGGHGRTVKLAVVVVAVVGVGAYFILRPAPPAKPVVAAAPEKAPAPPRVEKAPPVVDDPAADVAATPNDLVAAGERAFAAGRAADAESLFQRAIVREPKFLGALLGLGRLQLAAGDAEKAAGYFRRAVGSSPNDGGARIALGDALVKQGKVAEARKQYKKAKALNHPDAAARLAGL